MKKLLALACVALASASYAAVPEITYAEDPSQGVLVNSFKHNWFISAEGGANVLFSNADKNANFGSRIAPAFGIQGGKWFSPTFGFRSGISYMGTKGAAAADDAWGLEYDEYGNPEMVDGFYKTHVGQLGFNFDAMLNFTNWWCGYKPNRVYNFIAYVGGAAYLGFKHNTNGGWSTAFDTSLGLRAGIINSFNVSKQVALSLDIRYTALSANHEAIPANSINNNLSAFIGVTYLFPNRTWSAPIVPIIPEIEDCDPIKARLAECEARLQDTQKKLDECIRRPIPQPEVVPCNVPVATCYFRIGSANVSATDRNVLKSVASVMKADTSVKYEVCGWADNYTGTEAVNARLRTKRAETVKNILVKNGVDASQLEVTTNPGDRYAGKENVYLDRCVTIQSK